MLAITSESNHRRPKYRNTQLIYGLVYIFVTLCVLIFLNIYTSGTSQRLFYRSKEASMIEKCQLASAQIADLEVLNSTTVASAVSLMDNDSVTRLLVTDKSGICIYDSMVEKYATGQYVLLPEIVCAMEGTGSNVFTWEYKGGAMESRAAVPIISGGNTVGCVYMMEYNTEQAVLIQSLQKNVLSITIFLEIGVILISIFFIAMFSKRFLRILASMRIIREGDYSHKVEMTGNDELGYLAAEFNDLTDRLQSSEEKRRQFVGDASHELKTPLASIKLLSDSILQNDMDMQTVREFVGDIGNEADRLNRMTQKLLSLSRVESQQDGDCEIVYMGPTIERVVRMLRGIAEKNNITIDLNLEGDVPILVLEDDLYQIAFNLVENGIKYNSVGGKLTVTLLRQDDNAILQVRDTGMGIPEESLPQIFDRFYRVDKARARKTGGSGLGLSIVRSLVERNEGTIRAESTIGEGSVFTVTFPAFDTEEVDL